MLKFINMKNSLLRQHSGGKASALGNEYENRFFVYQLVQMLLGIETPSGFIIEVTRQKPKTTVDDVFIKMTGIDTFSQCKGSTLNNVVEISEILIKFIAEFNKSGSKKLLLTLKFNNPYLNELLTEARKRDFDEFEKRLTDKEIASNGLRDFYKKLATNIFNEENTDENRRRLYELFKVLEIELFDAKQENLVWQISRYYIPQNAEAIYNLLSTKGQSDWLDKRITKETILAELRRAKLNKLIKNELENKEKIQSKEITDFERILTDIINLSSSNQRKYSSSKVLVSDINSDDTLKWHFFHNLKTNKTFNIVKKLFLSDLTKATNGVKHQILSYFELCVDNYGKEVLDILENLEENTRDERVLKRILEVAGKLKLQDEVDKKRLVRVIKKLYKHQSSLVRDSAPIAIRKVIEYDFKEGINLLESLIKYHPVPKDTIQGSPTLSLRFNGRDNNRHVTSEAIGLLRELLTDPQYCLEALELATSIEKYFLLLENRRLQSNHGLLEDYSHIWFRKEKVTEDRLKYEYDFKERIPLEVERAILQVLKKDLGKGKLMIDTLIKTKQEVFLITVLRIGFKIIKTHDDIAKKILLEKDLWIIFGVRRNSVQKLLNSYLESYPRDLLEITSEISNLRPLKQDGRDLTKKIQQDLYIAIPENLKSEEIKTKLKELEDEMRLKATMEAPFKITTFHKIRPDMSFSKLETMTNEELIKLLLKYDENAETIGRYDAGNTFIEFSKKYPERVLTLITLIKKEKIHSDIIYHLVRGYCEILGKTFNSINIRKISDILNLLDENDTWAKKEIADFLEDQLRSDKVDIKPSTFVLLKNAIVTLCNDKNPDHEYSKSDDKRAEEGINIAINSVRGKAAEDLVLLLYYFPENHDLQSKVKDMLINDPVDAVKANIIFNLKYIIGKNYKFVSSMVKNFATTLNPRLAFALIYYYIGLPKAKLQSNWGNINNLFNVDNEDIQSKLGEFYGSVVLASLIKDEAIMGILKEYIGSPETRKSIAFQLESNLSTIFKGEEKLSLSRALKYILLLTNPKVEFELDVRERAAFLFERSELQLEILPQLIDIGIVDNIITDAQNIQGQSHLVSFLERCVLENKYRSEVVEIINKLVESSELFLSDSLIVGDIARITDRLLKDDDLSGADKSKLIKVYNHGLKRGWDEFYAIYWKRNS